MVSRLRATDFSMFSSEDLEAGLSLVHNHPEAEPANVLPATITSGGFTIGLEELVQVVRDRDVEALNQFNGVVGLSTRLKSDLERGIDRRDDEILQRRKEFGSNTYPCKKGKSFWYFIWKAIQFRPYMVMLLAAVMNSLLQVKGKAIHDGWYLQACAILVVFPYIIVRAFTEYKQSRHFEKFSEEKRNIRLEVIRGGRRVSICTYDIVVGDIVPLKNGCQVPADGVLSVANSLKIDEQEITGSHVIVQKDLINDPFLLSGSKVIEGIGTMLVTSVGINTKMGLETMEKQHETDEEKPFQVYVKWLAINASWLVVLFASVAYIVQLCRYLYGRTKKSDGTPMFIHGYTTSDEAMEVVIIALSFWIETIIVTVPIGLCIAVFVNLAKTKRKMMPDNALVQKPSACETMGYVTTIVCQKPGMLTFNQMSVVDVWAGGIRMQNMDNVSLMPSILKELIIEGIAQNTNGSVVFETGVAEPEFYGSPTEQAILSWGNKLGMKFDEARSASLLRHPIPFNPKRKYGGVALKVGTGDHVHWKGSAKVIVNSCKWYMDGANNRIAIDEQKREEVKGIIEKMCMRGMRCAALAYQSYELGSIPTTDEELSKLPQDLVLLAIIGIEDPCRPDTRNAIQLCNSGGVKVRMVTEDDVLTAQAVAMDCGILENSSGANIVTGAQFRDLSDVEREQIVVLAQASPSDSLLFVEALKNNGHVVAATGMGIHDTKTLLAADVSLAMGIGGTAAAKENSDIIILDDSFVTIPKVIQWCRSLYTNIQRYVLFRLTVTVSTLAICVVETVFYDAFPFTVGQLLWLNLIVDICGALALAYRPTARNLMGKPPVGRRDPFITKMMWFNLVAQVIYMVMFLEGMQSSDSILKLVHGHTGDAEKVKNTFIFNSLVFTLVFNELEIPIGDQTVKEVLRDNMFFLTIFSTIIVQIIIVQVLGIFNSAVRLDVKVWMLSVFMGFLSQVAPRSLEVYRYNRN